MVSLEKITHGKFFEMYLKRLIDPKNREKNGEQIWIELESWHLKKKGCNKFKSYGTFKKEKSNYYKNNR